MWYLWLLLGFALGSVGMCSAAAFTMYFMYHFRPQALGKQMAKLMMGKH